MDKILKLREKILGKTVLISQSVSVDDPLSFLGNTSENKAETLINRIIAGNNWKASLLRSQRKDIFKYIVSFWEKSIFSIPYKSSTFKGVNLAKRPFLSPTGLVENNGFAFAEQYRWDTFFQNRGLILIGGLNFGLDQVLNLVDVFEEFQRIPNALVTPFLSRPQPPLEIFSLIDLLEAGCNSFKEIAYAVSVVEKELVTEWLDMGTGKQNQRQTNEMVEKFGLLTRYEPHDFPLLVGCEDGKDHNWITVNYGSDYLPVQLNSIIYGILDRLEQFYGSEKWGNNNEKKVFYAELKEQLKNDFQKTFWCDKGKWAGFRNYSMKDQNHILYGDLAGEIWPLFTKIASPEQASITLENLRQYYTGDYGLSATSLDLRKGGSIENEPLGQWQFQWEYPNCWPPLMMVAAEGLKNYGFQKEALEYEKKWVDYIEKEFDRSRAIYEKGPFDSRLSVAPGLYGTMKGFGWTIAVYLWFLKDLAERNLLNA